MSRRSDRRKQRHQARDVRWMAACRAAKWVDPDVEPQPSAWGRWTPPKRWREEHAQIVRHTNEQLAYIASLWPPPFIPIQTTGVFLRGPAVTVQPFAADVLDAE